LITADLLSKYSRLAFASTAMGIGNTYRIAGVTVMGSGSIFLDDGAIVRDLVPMLL